MTLKKRLSKLEGVAKRDDQLRYVLRLIGDESLEAAKAAKGWQNVPDDEIFIIHRVFIKPVPRHEQH